MSETIQYRGKLKEIEVESIEAFIEEYYKDVELPSYYDSYEEMFEDDNFYVRNNKIYEIQREKICLNDDIFEINDNLEFNLKYYNGECGFEEALDAAFKNKRNK